MPRRSEEALPSLPTAELGQTSPRVLSFRAQRGILPSLPVRSAVRGGSRSDAPSRTREQGSFPSRDGRLRCHRVVPVLRKHPGAGNKTEVAYGTISGVSQQVVGYLRLAHEASLQPPFDRPCEAATVSRTKRLAYADAGTSYRSPSGAHVMRHGTRGYGDIRIAAVLATARKMRMSSKPSAGSNATHRSPARRTPGTSDA